MRGNVFVVKKNEKVGGDKNLSIKSIHWSINQSIIDQHHQIDKSINIYYRLTNICIFRAPMEQINKSQNMEKRKNHKMPISVRYGKSQNVYLN